MTQRVLRRMVCALGVCLAGCVAAFGAKGLRVYHIGNSLTDQAYGMHNIAIGKGYTDVLCGQFMIPGAPISYLWSHRAGGGGAPLAPIGEQGWRSLSGSVADYLASTPIDALVLQLYPLNNDNAQGMTDGGGNFAQAAYQGNPNCQVYVFGSYPERGMDWSKEIPRYNAMAVQGAAGISARFPNRKPVLVVPVMQVFDSIRIAITKGQAGSVTSWQNMFIPDGHANNNGDYLEAIVHFSTLYKADPHGAVISGLYFWAGPYSVTQSFASAVWDAAWPIVQRYPQSGVGSAGAAGKSRGLSVRAATAPVRAWAPLLVDLLGRAEPRAFTRSDGGRVLQRGVWITPQ